MIHESRQKDYAHVNETIPEHNTAFPDGNEHLVSAKKPHGNRQAVQKEDIVYFFRPIAVPNKNSQQQHKNRAEQRHLDEHGLN
jgi:hypothetical protein